MKDLIEFVARALVDRPDEVAVTGSESQGLELRVADDDLGIVIGRRGRTAQAMRTLLRAVASGPDGVELEIVDSSGPRDRSSGRDDDGEPE